MLVDTVRGLSDVVRLLSQESVVAFDAEMDSYYSYSTKLCLVQISIPGNDFLIDPLSGLDLSPLGEITNCPDTVKVFHAGENDVPFFRQQGLEFCNVFDTHLAARVLGLERHGLAALLTDFFDVELDKSFQRADWRLRPLPEGQAEYARLDTRYLIPLRENLLEMLHEQGRMEEASSEFERVIEATFREKEFDADGWARLKGARDLNPAQRGLLRELYLWRDQQARSEDRALFRIAPDPFLVSLARRDPRNLTELRKWGRHVAVRRYGPELMAALEKGRERGPANLPRPTRGRSDDLLTGRQQRCYQRLRAWRNGECKERGVDPDRVATNRQLRAIAQAELTTLEDLKSLQALETWRLAQYGAKILELASGSGS